MPKYYYVAKSMDGNDKTGSMEANDIREVAGSLHQEGYVLISANREAEAKKGLKIALPSLGASLKDKIFFTKNLQVMVASGLSLPRAISILAMQAKNAKFRSALTNIKDEITKGKSFSDSMQPYPDIFSEFFCSMVKVGEETGTLERVLEILTGQMEKSYELQSKIKGALIYPAVIICTMIGIGILMLIVVVPQLAATFRELKVDLPITTKIVIGLGDFMLKFWYLAVAAIVAAIFAFRLALKTKAGKKAYDYSTLRLPIFSPIIKNVNSAYTVRNLSSLIASGVSLPRALEITAGTLGNIYYRTALLEIKEKVKKGEKFSDALQRYDKIYPTTVIQMIAVGEETGETSGILIKLANFYENEVSEATRNLASVIEPVLMLLIGGVVGFFAISMVQPMYSMMDAIQ